MKSLTKIQNIAVIGAGTMGMGIAAHLANNNFNVLVFNRKKDENTNETLDLKFKKFAKLKPPALYHQSKAENISFFNLTDNLDELQDVDWVIESIAEDLALKKDLFTQICPFLKPDVIISTNTSGLSIKNLAEALPSQFHNRFLGVHFFNPPRYLKLVELIHAPKTSSEVIKCLTDLIENQLGKRVLTATDTPGFVANRLGVFALLNAVWNMTKFDLTVEELDMATGELIGRPRSATVRTSDIIGLDTVEKVVNDLHNRLTKDPLRETFTLPDFTKALIEKNHLGEKTNFTGNYQKVKNSSGKSQINMLNWKTIEYVPTTKKTPKTFTKIEKKELKARFNEIFNHHDKYAQFLQTHLLEVIEYTINTLPEIGNNPITADQGLQWGYGWQIGPLETLQLIDNQHLKAHPKLLETKQTLLAADSIKNAKFQTIYDLDEVVTQNRNFTIYQTDQNCWICTIHTKFNTINTQLVTDLSNEIDRLNQEPNIIGMGIINKGPHFSAGFDLSEMLTASRLMSWKKVDQAVADFQNLNQKIRFSQKPIVAGVFGITLGGGYEIARHCSALIAVPETYLGLPELGVGVVPAGGGCKEMLRRILPKIEIVPNLSASTFLQHLGETMGMGKVSSGAYDALDIGYLESSDTIIKNPDKLLWTVQSRIKHLHECDYQAPQPEPIKLWGAQMKANFMGGLKMFKQGGYISDYDIVVTQELVDILCGPFTQPTKVSEQFVLDLERASFLKLLKNKQTRERIKFMLENGKPLRN